MIRNSPRSQAFKKTAHEEVVRLQGGDGGSRAAWGQICDVSRREFEKVYSRLDVRLTEVWQRRTSTRVPIATRVRTSPAAAACLRAPNPNPNPNPTPPRWANRSTTSTSRPWWLTSKRLDSPSSQTAPRSSRRDEHLIAT